MSQYPWTQVFATDEHSKAWVVHLSRALPFANSWVALWTKGRSLFLNLGGSWSRLMNLLLPACSAWFWWSAW
jgi:hypothetical protein